MSLNLQAYFVFFILFLISATTFSQKGLTLEQALKETQRNNPILKSEIFNTSMAEADITDARLRPNITLSNETIQIAKSGDLAPETNWGHPENREVLWQLSKTFQIMGQRQNKIELAVKNLQLSQREYKDFERHILLEVAEKWNEVWTAQKQLDFMSTAKSHLDSLLKTNEIRYKNQVITKTDVLRTEVMANQYLLNWKLAQQELKNLKRELQLLMGTKNEMILDSSSILSPYQNLDLAAWKEKALQYRSDRQVSKTMLEVADANESFQKSMAYPQPEIGIIYNSQHTIPHIGFSASIELPFFNRNQGDILKSRIQKEQAEQQLQTLTEVVETEIEIAYTNYVTQHEHLLAFEKVLGQSQRILDNVQYAYLRGGTSILDFIEAQNSWLDVQEAFNEASANFRQSHVQLLFASGLINQL